MSDSQHHVYVQDLETVDGRRPIMEITVWTSALPLLWERCVHSVRTPYDSPLYAKWISGGRHALTRAEVMEVIDIVDARKFANALLAEG